MPQREKENARFFFLLLLSASARETCLLVCLGRAWWGESSGQPAYRQGHILQSLPRVKLSLWRRRSCNPLSEGEGGGGGGGGGEKLRAVQCLSVARFDRFLSL